jgi:Fic family protein
MSAKLCSINPDRNIPWNDLPELPIHDEIYRTTEIFEKLGEAKAALARLHGRSVVIPNQGLLINTISLQEAKASSEIENIFTTDDELYKAYSENNSKTTANGSSKEVLRYKEALWKGFHLLKNEQKFSEQYFINLFQEITQSNDEIRLEFNNTTIKQGGTGPNSGKVIYTPPRGKDIIKSKLSNLIEFLNDDEKYKMDHLLKMVIAHYQFEVIHPFRDGNGRTGRIFNIHYLTNKGLIDLPILYLSRYIIENKEDYYNGLLGVSQRGDWKTWILYMLSAIESTSNLTYDKINDIVSAKDSMLLYLRKEAKKVKKSEELINIIFTQPLIKVKHLQEAKLYSEATAREYLNILNDLKIVEKKTIEGHHYYLNKELYRILSE